MEQDAKKRLAVDGLFERDLYLLKNPICVECDAKIRHPLLPWIVGRKFGESGKRVLFVGKPHRGTPGKTLPSGFIDPIEMVPELWCTRWPYWSYTRKIAENLYGPQAADFIALTNLVKCTNVDADDGESKSTDRTTPRMVECCVRKLGVIWKEIEVLQPKTVVFYTYGLFRDSLQEVPVALSGSITDITPQDHHV